MICQKCGKQINDDYKMCPYCGTPAQRAVNTGQFQQNQQNNGYNYRNPQMPQSGSYNYGNRIQYTNHPKKNKYLKRDLLGELLTRLAANELKEESDSQENSILLLDDKTRNFHEFAYDGLPHEMGKILDENLLN